MFITDSMANVKNAQTVHEARLVHHAGITVVGIGINVFEQDEIRDIASKPSSKFLFQTYDYYNLNSLVPKVSSYICIGVFIIPQ